MFKLLNTDRSKEGGRQSFSLRHTPAWSERQKFVLWEKKPNYGKRPLAAACQTLEALLIQGDAIGYCLCLSGTICHTGGIASITLTWKLLFIPQGPPVSVTPPASLPRSSPTPAPSQNKCKYFHLFLGCVYSSL